MQPLFYVLGQLYEFAEHASIKQFLEAVIRLMGSSIDFDGAVICASRPRSDLHSGMEIHYTHVYGRDEGLADDYEPISGDDPIAAQFLNGLDVPLTCDCYALYREQELARLERFAHRHGLHHLLLFGDRPFDRLTGRWLVALYRRTDRPFENDDGERMVAMWPHLSRVLSINRRCALNGYDEAFSQRATALVNAHGVIEAADPNFIALLMREWPGAGHKRVPGEVWDYWQRGLPYCGKNVEMEMHRRSTEYILCLAKERVGSVILTPTERLVAQRFSAGYSHKHIAVQLSISRNTVRSHIASVYRKLGVHDKAALAQSMMPAPKRPN
jgi:DNA-binding CsgD family transcriptional regulator